MNKPVIICIDDEVTVLDSIAIEINKYIGDLCLIETAEGGEEALELLTELLAEEYEVALVISDYIMPEMKGDEVLKQIHEISPNTIKIMLTGQADIEAVGNAIKDAQLYRYIAKPWQSEDLELTIREAVYSYIRDRKLAENNVQLQQMNRDLEKSNREQAALISKLHEAEAERQKFIEELFEVNCSLELALQAESELTTAADRFVPNEFISLLERESIVDVQLGDNVQQEMSVLFSDIRDFTTLSESMTPSDSFKLINAYLSRMEPAINENNGFIDKYIGDAIMALFSGGADDAVKGAIAMLHILREYNTTRQTPERPPLEIGIGINTGDLMLGVVGGNSRMDSTVIGDTVNLASRVESMTKIYRVSLLITHHTFCRLKDSGEYDLRIIDKVKVKGKSELVTIYEVFDADAEKIREGKLATKTAFEQALVLYNMNAFTQAAQLFADCLRQNPEDKVPHLYLERCKQKLRNRDWGVTGEFSSQ